MSDFDIKRVVREAQQREAKLSEIEHPIMAHEFAHRCCRRVVQRIRERLLEKADLWENQLALDDIIIYDMDRYRERMLAFREAAEELKLP